MPLEKRPRLVVGNWKMNGLRGDLSELTEISEIAATSPMSTTSSTCPHR